MPCRAICQTEAMLCQSDREYPSFRPSVPSFLPFIRSRAAPQSPCQNPSNKACALKERSRKFNAQRSKCLAFQTAPIALQTLQIYNTGCKRQPVSPLRSTPHTSLSSTTAYRTYILRLSNEKGKKITYPHSARSAFCAPSLYYRTNRAAAATPAVRLDSCCPLGEAP